MAIRPRRHRVAPSSPSTSITDRARQEIIDRHASLNEAGAQGSPTLDEAIAVALENRAGEDNIQYARSRNILRERHNARPKIF